MKSMCSARRFYSVFVFLLLFLVALSSGQAQSRRSRAAQKPSAKKSGKSLKVAKKEVKKDSRNSRKADSRKLTAREKRLAEREQKSTKLTARQKRELAAEERKADRKGSKKGKAELRKELAERRRIEAERRRAAIEEQRRRAEAARQARLRQIAFENGLKDETRQNILSDNTEGEDLQVRAAAVNALGNKAGTVVVMEAQTGKVLTIVNQNWAEKNSFKPCSTIKLVTGVAGIDQHVINQEGGIGDSTAGVLLDGAIAHSNNGYFQRVGSNVGSSKMVQYARQLGLGEPTGLNVEGETGGRVPNGNNNLRIYSHGDDFEVTPLQLAVLTSAISNGGKRVVPQIVRSRTELADFRPQFRRSVAVASQELDEMLPGMIGTAEYGTAHRGVDASLGIAGKTGSCIYKGTWIGLFTSVAPVENPKYSVVVITRGSGERGKYAAAIAGRVYQALSPKIRPSRNLALAESRFGKRSSIQNTGASIADEDDDDDTSADDTAAAGSKTDDQNTGAETAPAQQYRPAPAAVPVKKPLITKTAQSTPKFSPVIIQYDKSGAEIKSRPRVVRNK
jgi:penicillin-binding protein 2